MMICGFLLKIVLKYDKYLTESTGFTVVKKMAKHLPTASTLDFNSNIYNEV